MKKISIMIMVLVVVLASCKKTPEVNLKYVDVERDLVTVGTTTANIQSDYKYIATLKKAYLLYGEGEAEVNMTSAEMRVVQNTLYVELTGLKENTTYGYYYEFHNGFNSMKTVLKNFKTETSPGGVTLPTVITSEVTEITATSAMSGGEVTDDGGAEVTERGICWSTNANPTLNDNHIAAGSGMGAFLAVMSGLDVNTIYHVRAYAINETGTAYGLDREFVTIDSGEGCDCGYVDLGLPSGTLWATCNIGASSPRLDGDYFAWGETQPKNNYNWSTYLYSNGSENSLTKYCNNSGYGYNGFTDNLTVMEIGDDAATSNWGAEWRTPTKEEWQELYNNCTYVWMDQSTVRFTGPNGNTIFLPTPGYRMNDQLLGGGYGYYWSNSLKSENPSFAYIFYFIPPNIPDPTWCPAQLTSQHRYFGLSVRAVRSARQN